MLNEPDVPVRRPDRYGWSRIAYVVLLALFVYVVVLFLYIVPLQGGLIPARLLVDQQNLTEAESQYTDPLPLQGVDMDGAGRSILIAFAMLTHTVFANLHLGGAWIIVITALFYHRYHKQRYKNLARSLTLFNVILFSTGSTFGAAGLFFFMWLFPSFTKIAFHVYWWPGFLYFVLFGAIIFSLFTFWYKWDQLKPRTHLALGVVYIAATVIQTLAIDAMGSGMLTPGVSAITFGQSGLLTMPLEEAFRLWINPTTLNLLFHRQAAALGFYGFMIAAIAILHYRDQPDFPARKQWDWVAAYGIAWGLLGLIMQPVLGQLMMTSIMDHSEGAFQMIMHGPRAWEMLLMVRLLSTLFLSVTAYFITRRDQLLSRAENRTLRNMFTGFLAIVAIAAFVLVQPAWLGTAFSTDAAAWINPIGGMPLKYFALFVMVAVGTAILMTDIIILTSEAKEGQWGYLSRGSIITAFAAGILGTTIVAVMGFVRESARAPWTIYGIVPMSGWQDSVVPIPLPQIVLVWLGVLILSWIIFWFVARVTAYHPAGEDGL